MPTNCEFKFDRATPIYYSGEQICGNIKLTTTKLKRLEAIIINCKGFAQVNWYDNNRKIAKIEYNDSNKDDDDDDDDNKIHYQGYETYINENTIIQHERLQLPAGKYEYNFRFNLPAQCAATCKQKYGEIIYSVNLILKRRAKYDRIFEKCFIVKNRLDLNVEKSKYLAQNFVVVNNQGIDFSIPRCGFVPGQVIKCALKLPAYDEALKCRICLCQKYIFQSQQPTDAKKELLWILAIEKADIPAYTTHSFYEAGLRIPLLTPISTSMNLNQIINISYYLEAVILNKQKFVIAKHVIPITLGTKALKGIASDYNQEEVDEEEAAEFCYDNLEAQNVELPNKLLAFNDLPPTRLDLSYGKSLTAYERSPLLAKKLRRLANSNIIRMPINICVQLFQML